MFDRYQKYIELFLKSIPNCLVLAFFQLISFDVIAEGRLAAIANGMISASAGTTKQLQMLGIYGGALLVLLVLLNMVRERKGKKRVMALLAIQLLCNALLIYHLS